MQLSLSRQIAASPDVVFALVSIPELMNLWSQARIELVDLGDGGHPGGIGALRRAHLPGRLPLVLDEVIEDSQPGRRLGYRVFRGPGVRNHRGVIELAPSGGGTAMTWNVDLVLAGGALLEAWTELKGVPALEQSVDTMCAVAAMTDRAPSPPPTRDIDDAPGVAALRERAAECLTEQVALAAAMAAEGDPRHWFTRIYEHVTRLQIEACDRGDYRHPGWVLRLVERFHHYYTRNLDHPLVGETRPAHVESHWRQAFHGMRGARLAAAGNRFRELGHAVFHGMRAHIEDDLPRALADVYVDGYAGRCDYVRFRGDFLRMDGVFQEATRRGLAAVDRREWPLVHRLLDRLPAEARDGYLAWRMYDIAAERTRAFDRGGRIAARLVEVASAGPGAAVTTARPARSDTSARA